MPSSSSLRRASICSWVQPERFMAVTVTPSLGVDSSSAAAGASGPSPSRERGRVQLVERRTAGFPLGRWELLTILVTSTTVAVPSVGVRL
eukprot:11226535-Alexandrium_andersonii.AAC.1